MAQAVPVTPEEMVTVFGHELPEDIKLSARLQGKRYSTFAALEHTVAHMHEIGLIPRDLYDQLERNNRFSYKQHMAADGAVDFIKAISESKNPLALMAPVSQAAGAVKKGDAVFPILKENVAGMDSRSIGEIMNTQAVQKAMSFRYGLEVMEKWASKQVKEGEADSEDLKKLVYMSREFKGLFKKLGLDLG